MQLTYHKLIIVKVLVNPSKHLLLFQQNFHSLITNFLESTSISDKVKSDLNRDVEELKDLSKLPKPDINKIKKD